MSLLSTDHLFFACCAHRSICGYKIWYQSRSHILYEIIFPYTKCKITHITAKFWNIFYIVHTNDIFFNITTKRHKVRTNVTNMNIFATSPCHFSYILYVHIRVCCCWRKEYFFAVDIKVKSLIVYIAVTDDYRYIVGVGLACIFPP